jgi:hypothetical protein
MRRAICNRRKGQIFRIGIGQEGVKKIGSQGHVPARLLGERGTVNFSERAF